MTDRRRFAPATQRNREPIFDVLTRYVRPGARVVEIASGSGEHAVFLAEKLAVESWQPTDPSEDARASIDAWRGASEATRVLPAMHLDVLSRPWPTLRADVLVNINMIHISPWSACEALFSGARDVVEPGGIMFMYGPYKRGGAFTAPSDEAFDARLRSENPAWGVRDLEAVLELATRAAMSVMEIVAMPANNFSIVLRAASTRDE